MIGNGPVMQRSSGVDEAPWFHRGSAGRWCRCRTGFCANTLPCGRPFFWFSPSAVFRRLVFLFHPATNVLCFPLNFDYLGSIPASTGILFSSSGTTYPMWAYDCYLLFGIEAWECSYPMRTSETVHQSG